MAGSTETREIPQTERIVHMLSTQKVVLPIFPPRIQGGGREHGGTKVVTARVQIWCEHKFRSCIRRATHAGDYDSEGKTHA
jgi:hypothetical protein